MKTYPYNTNPWPLLRAIAISLALGSAFLAFTLTTDFIYEPGTDIIGAAPNLTQAFFWLLTISIYFVAALAAYKLYRARTTSGTLTLSGDHLALPGPSTPLQIPYKAIHHIDIRVVFNQRHAHILHHKDQTLILSSSMFETPQAFDDALQTLTQNLSKS